MEGACPKCGQESGDDWSQCGNECAMPSSPVYRPIVAEQQCGSEIDRVRNIITQWNFGPLQDRDALDAIFDIVGDNIQ